MNAVPASAAPQCLGEEVVRTDGEGRFVFPEQEDLLFFIVFGDRLDTWSLCFEDAAGRVFVWTDSGWWGGPGEQTLDCSLDPKTEMPCRALSPEGD